MTELNKALLRMKQVTDASFSGKFVMDHAESTQEGDGEYSHNIEGLLMDLNAHGITPQNNELIEGLENYASKGREMDEARKVIPSTPEILERKAILREEIEEARINAVKLIEKWEPLITGAF